MGGRGWKTGSAYILLDGAVLGRSSVGQVINHGGLTTMLYIDIPGSDATFLRTTISFPGIPIPNGASCQYYLSFDTKTKLTRLIGFED